MKGVRARRTWGRGPRTRVDVQVHKPRHRVLVHVVDGAHVRDAEEEQRRVEGHGAVLLACGVDHDLGLGRLLGLDLDLVRRHLGLGERVDEAFVVEDVAGGLREQLEDGRLDVLELCRHLCRLDDELILRLLEVGPLLRDRNSQKLVLEALLSDRKVE